MYLKKSSCHSRQFISILYHFTSLQMAFISKLSLIYLKFN
nr:MAG TPA: hypothetical protein [Inoviridae sp.]